MDPDAIDDDWASSGRTAASLCSIVLDRIDDTNGKIGALTDVLHESAIEEAHAVDARVALGQGAGRLAGWPIAVKDNIDTVPARCSAGLAFLEDRRPAKDAEVVDRLRREGAVIVGVAYTDSGAFGVTSPGVVNPNWPERIVGGSSGGSAAAVAAGLCLAALGTDTGGSVRIPAACCGVVGFKPTRHRVSTAGVRALAVSFDHVGVLADSVRRVRSVCEVIDRQLADDPRDPVSASSSLVVGIPTDFFADAHQEVLHAMSRAVGLLADRGVSIAEVEIGSPDGIVQSHLVLSLTEAARAHGPLHDGVALQMYPEAARQGILLGQSYTADEHVAAARCSRAFTSRVDAVLERVDFLMLPTLPVSPPMRDSASVALQGREMDVLSALIRYTAAFNQTGHPVIALPVFFDDVASIPGSVQLVGRMQEDGRLLDVAEAFEPLACACRHPILVKRRRSS